MSRNPQSSPCVSYSTILAVREQAKLHASAGASSGSLCDSAEPFQQSGDWFARPEIQMRFTILAASLRCKFFFWLFRIIYSALSAILADFAEHCLILVRMTQLGE
jgi:hypothetical protein